jgi:hypothetical protein
MTSEKTKDNKYIDDSANYNHRVRGIKELGKWRPGQKPQEGIWLIPDGSHLVPGQ